MQECPGGFTHWPLRKGVALDLVGEVLAALISLAVGSTIPNYNATPLCLKQSHAFFGIRDNNITAPERLTEFHPY